ncbi:hypothetical protein AALP_AA5G275200 [Arabis alpina]|uniref:Uncharacterized protein n=1 Tax=Arabis alpina TaxID=50452 RepID=A0A087GZQ9_ARAAL|nr:hypothetical protein AALP_AA5G275200 [Arabis alpina]
MRKEEIPEKTRTFPVDTNLPKWVCQNCHNSLTIVGVDSMPESSSTILLIPVSSSPHSYVKNVVTLAYSIIHFKNK